MDDNWYHLWTRYWWLLFPFFWMVAGGVRLWLRHARAQRALDLIKSYVDQGKEAPPEIMALLQQPERRDAGSKHVASHYGWIPVFLFGALSTGFVTMAIMQFPARDDFAGLIFVALIMAGLSLGFLVSTLAHQRQPRDQNPPR